MGLDRVPSGKDLPNDFNVVVEIPMHAEPIKYEVDKESGAIFVDRFLHTAMFYPGNYGFIPHTLSDDGDPCDVIVLNPTPVVPGCVIRSRPIGVLMMVDEAGGDEKILAVPVDKLNPYYTDIASYRQLPTIMVEQIEHFFTRYKDLEKGKSVTVKGWGDAGEAAEMIAKGMQAHQDKLAAKKAQIVHWKAEDIQGDKKKMGLDGSPTKVVKIFTPPARHGGQIFKGEPEEIVPQVVEKLKDAVIAAAS